MRDKGTNEVRAMLTDVTIAVIRRTIDADPDKSQNSIIRDVMDAWAKKVVIRDLRKRDKAIFRINEYEKYGIDTATLRQETAKYAISGAFAEPCRNNAVDYGTQEEQRMKRDRFGRLKRKREMTEEERFRATDRFEKELRRMDAERLKKFNLRIDWVLVVLLAMAGFCAFYFLR